MLINVPVHVGQHASVRILQLGKRVNGLKSVEIARGVRRKATISRAQNYVQNYVHAQFHACQCRVV